MDNVQGSRASKGVPNQNEPKKQQPLVWVSLTVPCPWAPEGLATSVPLVLGAVQPGSVGVRPMCYLFEIDPYQYVNQCVCVCACAYVCLCVLSVCLFVCLFLFVEVRYSSVVDFIELFLVPASAPRLA